MFVKKRNKKKKKLAAAAHQAVYSQKEELAWEWGWYNTVWKINAPSFGGPEYCPTWRIAFEIIAAKL